MHLSFIHTQCIFGLNTQSWRRNTEQLSEEAQVKLLKEQLHVSGIYMDAILEDSYQSRYSQSGPERNPTKSEAIEVKMKKHFAQDDYNFTA